MFFAALAFVSGCGGDNTTVVKPAARKPNRAELDRLANTLVKNYRAKGATFTATVGTATAAATVRLTGEIEWTGATTASAAANSTRGHAAVTYDFTGDRPSVTNQVWWIGGDKPVVINGTDDTSAAAIRAAGLPAFQWWAQQPDPTKVPLHMVLQFLNAGAARRPENTALLLQKGDVRWLRSASVKGKAVDVFRVNDSTRYWVGTADGMLYRFEADSVSLGTVTIDYLRHGTQKITTPPPRETAPVGVVG